MQHKKRWRIRNKRLFFNGILFVVLGVSTMLLTITLIQYLHDRASYSEARALAVSTPVPTEVATLAPEAMQTPEPLPTPPITVDFAALQKEGRHVRAWLYSEETAINYPVVYYKDNSYFLNHDYTGKSNSAGALFFDARAGTALDGESLIIYGHHMKDGSMFKSLLQYQHQAYYDAHPTMYLITFSGNYRIDLFAGRYIDSSDQYFPVWFQSDHEKMSFVNTAINASDFVPADAEYHADTRLISLVTCAYSNYVEDSKYQVLGWLVPIG